jgi:hypothetical protein
VSVDEMSCYQCYKTFSLSNLVLQSKLESLFLDNFSG